MRTNIIAAAILAAALAPVAAEAHPAGGSDSGEAIAVEACSAFNEYGPVTTVAVVEDGMGDFLVWLEDVDEDLWACNANTDGDIYANVPVLEDLLGGEGAEMLHLVSGATTRYPEKQAERLCVAAADDDVEIIATVEDGLGDYLVWLAVDEETFIMCNASAEGELYTFEEVGMPINEEPELAPAISSVEKPVFEPAATDADLSIDPATAIEETPARPTSPAPVRPTQFG